MIVIISDNVNGIDTFQWEGPFDEVQFPTVEAREECRAALMRLGFHYTSMGETIVRAK